MPDSSLTWLDRFTGTRYICDQIWLVAVYDHLSMLLAQAIADSLQKVSGGTAKSPVHVAADAAARFWSETYYQLLIPLRFGQSSRDQQIAAPALLDVASTVALDGTADVKFRTSFLDDTNLPPILPDTTKGATDGWLIADRLLMDCAAFTVLAEADDSLVDDDIVHSGRLAALTYPFHDKLHEQLIAIDARVDALSMVWSAAYVTPRGQTEAPQDAVAVLIDRICRGQLAGEQVQVVLVAVQRVKKYVFETSTLNEIRGGSTLLDRITDNLKQRVGDEIGPEVVLRAAGSTLLFLAPATPKHSTWPAQLRSTFFAQTDATFPAAGSCTVDMQALFTRFGETIGAVYREVDADRARARLPVAVTLPFETRCTLCQTRAAAYWTERPGNLLGPSSEQFMPICQVCHIKRNIGKSQRRTKTRDLLDDLRLSQNPSRRHALLQIKPAAVEAQLPNDLESLLPEKTRRRLIGVVYSDGNNFGAVSLAIPDVALSLQWSARVAYTTRAAVALALGHATQQAAQGNTAADQQKPSSAFYEHIPFQILALGGDDLSLFAWGPVALYFAAEFTRLTDLELRATSPDRLRPDDHLHFSTGVLVTDEHTPVAKSVNFAEDTLLKWAKQASKISKTDKTDKTDQTSRAQMGNIAMLLAQTAEGIPTDLERYRETVYELGDREHFRFIATLRPYSATELAALLQTARGLIQQHNLGRLQRLASAFYGAKQGVYAGLLHYAYQRGRVAEKDKLNRERNWIYQVEQTLLEQLYPQMAQESSASEEIKPLIHYPDEFDAMKAKMLKSLTVENPRRRVFGLQAIAETDRRRYRFSPLWDLVELGKILS